MSKNFDSPLEQEFCGMPAADPLCGQPEREIKSDCVCTFECQCGECPHFTPDPVCANADCGDVERLRDALREMWDEPADKYQSGDEYAQFFRNRIRAALAATGKPLSEHHGPYRRCHADPMAAFRPKE